VKGILRTLLLAKHYWLPAGGSFIALLIVNASNLITPQVLRMLIDQGIGKLEMNLIYTLALVLIGLAILRGVFQFFQSYWAEIVAQSIAYEMRNQIFTKLQNLSFSYHDQSQTGALMTRMTSDVELVKTFTGIGLLQLVGGLISFVGTLIILFVMNWRLTLIFVGMLPVLIFFFSIFVRGLMPLSKTVQQKLSALNTVLQENIAGIRIVKAFAREDYEIDRFGTRNVDFKDENIKLIRLFSNFFPVIFFIANVASVLVVWIGGLMVMRESVTIGELVAFVSYQGSLLFPLFMLGMIGSMLSRAEASAERIYEVIDATSDVVEKENAFELPEVQGRIEFKDVCFRYRGSETCVLQDINFVAEPNETVAILGQTGSGKSSIINLVPRFYDVTEGSVTIDGIDVRNVTIESLRNQIGIVLQETTLFAGTLRENIAYGKPESTDEEIIQAAKIAQAYEFIHELPDGLDTLVGERGVGLSGGQKQRIAIARALLVQPRILIMDDSTSSVDTETEYLIQKALEDLRKGRTTLVIAQRISTVRNADKILVLDQGKIVSQGKHKELMETSEIYAEILATQFGGEIDLLESALEVSK
jgi:ATP-binding cassette subfamily B protein